MIARLDGMLLPVPPVGRGTDQAEGLSSYVVRLAVEHVVPTRILAFHVLGEATGIRSVRMMLMGRRGALLNGTGVWSRNLSSVLERLTLQPGLERLTMLPWGRLLSKTGLLSGVRRWCPDLLPGNARTDRRMLGPADLGTVPGRLVPGPRAPVVGSLQNLRSNPALAPSGHCAWLVRLLRNGSGRTEGGAKRGIGNRIGPDGLVRRGLRRPGGRFQRGCR